MQALLKSKWKSRSRSRPLRDGMNRYLWDTRSKWLRNISRHLRDSIRRNLMTIRPLRSIMSRSLLKGLGVPVHIRVNKPGVKAVRRILINPWELIIQYSRPLPWILTLPWSIHVARKLI